MLRAVLLGLLAVSVTSSCSGGSDGEQVAPGAVAGKVLEASGNVAATRNGASRALAAGSEVFADDTIDTASGSVLILLHHNNARWAVESGQHTRVDQSLAWKLAKQAGPAKTVDHASSAAGREGERTAADTRATSDTGEEAGKEGRTRGINGAKAESAPAPAAAMAPQLPVESAATPTVAPGGGAADPGDAAAGGGGASKGGKAAPPAAAPRTVKEKNTGGAAQDPAPPPDVRATSVTRPGPPPEPRLHSALEARRAELRRCLDGRLALTLVVRAVKGAPAIELAGGAAGPAVRACLERVVKGIPMVGVTGSASIELSR
jgi:hypothetical protein